MDMELVIGTKAFHVPGRDGISCERQFAFLIKLALDYLLSLNPKESA